MFAMCAEELTLRFGRTKETITATPNKQKQCTNKNQQRQSNSPIVLHDPPMRIHSRVVLCSLRARGPLQIIDEERQGRMSAAQTGHELHEHHRETIGRFTKH